VALGHALRGYCPRSTRPGSGSAIGYLQDEASEWY
jgi:hypothetical protein